MRTKEKVLIITGLILLLVLFTFLGIKAQDTITIKHKAYSTTFSKSKGYPVKVEWWLTKAALTCPVKVKRGDKFIPDPKLAAETDLQSSYTGQGFDRGHNFPAADASCDQVANEESFYFSNMTAQYPALNRGDGKIGVGVLAQFNSDVAIDELKMAVEVAEWAKGYKPRLICFDKYTSMSVAERLSQSGYKVQDMSGQVFYQACSDLLDAIVNQRLVHNGQDSLVNSINNCAAKETDAGWRIVRRKSAGDVTAAIGLAMLIHQMLKPQSKPQIIAV